MAEFGCNTNTREWGEIASLYSSDMTPVYSGGLAYEYTAEANGYGLVSNTNGQVTTNDDFDRLEKAYKATPNPSGDGGYSETTTPSECPATSEDWAVANTLLPAMPSLAQKFMDEGAGKGPGLGDDVTPSQYGGKSYSSGLVEMNGAKSSGSGTSGGTASGSSSSASGTASKSAGSGFVTPSVSAVFAVPVFVSLAGVLVGMGLMV